MGDAATFCPHCGRRLDPGSAWFYHPIWILVLALTVLGPFALFLVWKSSKLSAIGKAVLAIAILVYTGLCVFFTYQIVAMQLEHLSEFNDVMRRIKSP
ncbi:MAG: hypothetical protein GWP08_13070 [Nitrospiraceae bacterium]|nr:hypothetical protein [Nitrospiraceae bacterium]